MSRLFGVTSIRDTSGRSSALPASIQRAAIITVQKWQTEDYCGVPFSRYSADWVGPDNCFLSMRYHEYISEPRSSNSFVPVKRDRAISCFFLMLLLSVFTAVSSGDNLRPVQRKDWSLRARY